MKVQLLNFVEGPGIPLLNFEEGLGVPLLNFEGCPESQGPEVLVPLLHHAVDIDIHSGRKSMWREKMHMAILVNPVHGYVLFNVYGSSSLSRFFHFFLVFLWCFPCLIQKQPPEEFNEKCCSKKFRKIHSKTPVLESLFNIVAGLKDGYFC